MFHRLGRLVLRFRYLLVVAWVVAAAAAVLVAPSISEYGTADETSFLPADAGSMVARGVAAKAFPADAAAGQATIVATRPGGLTDADRAYLTDLDGWVTSPAAPEALRRVVTGVLSAEARPEIAAMFRSSDGALEFRQVNLSVAPFQDAANAAVDAIRARVAEAAPAGLAVRVTGPAGIGRDYLAAVAEGTDRTTIATIVLVVAMLLLIYRSPIAALVPLLTIGAAYLVSLGLLGTLAASGWRVPSLIQSFSVVLVFGVGTDYTIFLISRFREELGRNGWREAGASTVGRIGAVIAASAATVVVGLGSMAVARFGLIQTMGPALALTILVTLGAGLTLTPALLAIAGDRLFWPRRIQRAVPTADTGAEPGPAVEPGAEGPWGELAGRITARPGLIALAVLAVLALPLAGLTFLRSNFDALNEMPGTAEARLGFEDVAAHLDRGQILPISALVEAAPGVDLRTSEGLAIVDRVARRIASDPGVASVRSAVVATLFRPSARLEAMAALFSVPADPAAGLQALIQAEQDGRLEDAVRYLEALRDAYPDLATEPSLSAAIEDLETVDLEAALALMAPPGTLGFDRAAAALAHVIPRTQSDLAALAAVLRERPDDLFVPVDLTGPTGEAARAALSAYVSDDGSVARLSIVTRGDPYSTASFDTIGRLREALAAPGAGVGRVLLGGATVESADVRLTIAGDFVRVAIITLAGVLIVLAVLLRSLVAPLYLVLTVLLSYATTLGLAALVFQGILGYPGVNYFLPLVVFVLLVALGSDYNIFLMSRVREESLGRELRAGIRVASARTGAVITSAGLILAGTFAAMTTAPLSVLVQAGTVVAMGVLIDTFLVRSLLVPAITTLLGEWSWWPFGRSAPGA